MCDPSDQVMPIRLNQLLTTKIEMVLAVVHLISKRDERSVIRTELHMTLVVHRFKCLVYPLIDRSIGPNNDVYASSNLTTEVVLAFWIQK